MLSDPVPISLCSLLNNFSKNIPSLYRSNMAWHSLSVRKFNNSHTKNKRNTESEVIWFFYTRYDTRALRSNLQRINIWKWKGFTVRKILRHERFKVIRTLDICEPHVVLVPKIIFSRKFSQTSNNITSQPLFYKYESNYLAN